MLVDIGRIKELSYVRDTGEWLTVEPRLPTGWSAMRVRLCRHGSELEVDVDSDGAASAHGAGAGEVLCPARPA